MGNIGYHTRLYNNAAQKVVGGSFGGGFDLATVERLVSANFTVTVRNSGTPVFVDREGREVRLYISVDVASTSAGMAALKTWRADKAKQAEAEKRQQEAEQEEIDALMNGLSHEEIVRRLRTTQ